MIVASFHTRTCNHLLPQPASHFPEVIAGDRVNANRPSPAGPGLYPACSRKSSCRCTVGKASGKRGASVLLRCCSGIASLLVPCTSVVHPLNNRWTTVVHRFCVSWVFGLLPWARPISQPGNPSAALLENRTDFGSWSSRALP